MHMRIAFAVVAFTALPALAADQVITVSFDSILAMQTKGGERLDPALFSFGPAVPGEEDVGHASTSGFGKPKDESCRWALLGTFMKFQNKARAAGKKVVGVRTYAGDRKESSKASECVCLAGGIVVRSTIKATYK